MTTHKQYLSPASNTALAFFSILPAMVIIFITEYSIRDLETYLNQITPNAQSRRTFENLNMAAHQCAVMFLLISSGIAASIFTRNYRLIAVLVVGNLIATGGCLLTEDFSDPQWTSILFANVIGMFVSFSLAALLAIKDFVRAISKKAA